MLVGLIFIKITQSKRRQNSTFAGEKMKIEITYTKKNGVHVTLVDQPKKMGDDEFASIIEDAIQELRNMQLSMMANNDHV